MPETARVLFKVYFAAFQLATSSTTSQLYNSFLQEGFEKYFAVEHDQVHNVAELCPERPELCKV